MEEKEVNRIRETYTNARQKLFQSKQFTEKQE